MDDFPPILAVVGPTGSGKTPLTLLLAEQLDGEIISADSRQIYKCLDIGTAKPSQDELRRVKHHFIDLLEPVEEFNAGEFGRRARDVILDLAKRRKFPILVGGSGLYVKAVIDGLFEGPGKHPEVRAELEDRYQRLGAEVLLEELKRVDPASAALMSPTKPRRIIRALEVYFVTGRPISQLHSEQEPKPLTETLQVALQWERKELYTMINQRVDKMMASGLLEEVKELQERGLNSSLNALNTVGYREMFDYLNGKTSLERAIELIKQNTRRFAKRQMTWFRADERIHWIPMDGAKSFAQAAEEVTEIIKERRIF